MIGATGILDCRPFSDHSELVKEFAFTSEHTFMSPEPVHRCMWSFAMDRNLYSPRHLTERPERSVRYAWFHAVVRSVVLLLLLCQTCLAEDPRGPAGDEDVAVLKSSELEVVIANNKSRDAGGVQHKAGYNGIIALTAEQQPDSPFVPAYAGINLEHYFDGSPRSDSHIFFEPRYAEMRLTRVDERTVELYQPMTPFFKVESWTRFEVQEPHAIDFTFRCIPHRSDYVGDFLGVFWASYLNGPLNKSMYFIDAQSSLKEPLWRQLCTQLHNRDSTILHASDSTELTFEGGDTLFANESPLRYSAPFFYGRFRDMVLIYVFKPSPGLRFTHSPSGGGSTPQGDDTNPAWDFQLILPSPEAGKKYRLDGRLVYKQWTNREDILAEVSKYHSSQSRN